MAGAKDNPTRDAWLPADFTTLRAERGLAPATLLQSFPQNPPLGKEHSFNPTNWLGGLAVPSSGSFFSSVEWE